MGESQFKSGMDAEDYIEHLLNRHFLKYWSIRNPKDEENGKEICDILLVFQNICIVFSIKNYKYNGNHETFIKKTVTKSVKQLSGAEKKLFYSNRTFHFKDFKNEDFYFKPDSYKNIYYISISAGDDVDFFPLIRKTNRGKNITIFNRESFQNILRELDTIKDFTTYLGKRETYFNTIPNINLLGTEMDLCAYYLKNKGTFPLEETDKNPDVLVLELEGAWDEYIQADAVKRKKEANSDSYLIDEIVDRDLIKMDPDYHIIKIFMGLSRLQRRVIGRGLLQHYEKYVERIHNTIARRMFVDEDEGFCLIYIFYGGERIIDNVNGVAELAIITAHIFTGKKVNRYIAISFNKDLHIDYMYVENIDLTPDEEVEYIKKARKLDWLTDINRIHFIEKEYPDS